MPSKYRKIFEHQLVNNIQFDSRYNIKNAYYHNFFPLYENYRIRTLLRESSHIYEPSKYSSYRRAISKIADDIFLKLYDNNYKFTEVFKDDDLRCKVIRYNNEFKNFKLINILQIFITIGNDIEGQALVIDQNKDDELCLDEYNPSFEIVDNIINVGIILIKIPREKYLKKDSSLISDIQTVLAHELIHMLDALWNAAYITTYFNNSITREDLEPYFPDTADMTNMFKNSGYTISDIAFLIHQCLYFTSDTEQHAYIETIISELKQSVGLHSYDLNTPLQKQWYAKKFSKTYQNLILLTYILNRAIINPELWNTNESELLFKIINLLYPNNELNFNLFIKQLNNWKNNLESFMKKIQKVCVYYNENFMKL